MTQLLFRNRWFALIWAIGICFAIARFFDVGGGQEELQKAASDIRASRAQPVPRPQPAEAPEQAEAAGPDAPVTEPGEATPEATEDRETEPPAQQGLAEQPVY
jgi:hypothetical protein